MLTQQPSMPMLTQQPSLQVILPYDTPAGTVLPVQAPDGRVIHAAVPEGAAYAPSSPPSQLAPSFAPSFAPDDDASTGDERQSPTAAPTLEGMVEAERYAYIGGGLAGFLLIVCCVATAISRLRRDPEETDKRTSARALDMSTMFQTSTKTIEMGENPMRPPASAPAPAAADADGRDGTPGGTQARAEPAPQQEKKRRRRPPPTRASMMV